MDKPASERAESPSVYVNERGETCIGSQCFTFKLSDGDPDTVDIEFNEDSCTDDQRAVVQRLKDRVVKGAGSRYEFKRKR